jgi:polyhydroxyalkanoate synthase
MSTPDRHTLIREPVEALKIIGKISLQGPRLWLDMLRSVAIAADPRGLDLQAWQHMLVAQLTGNRAHQVKVASFWARQLQDALSPKNFALSNPKVLRATLESGGMNLLRGTSNFLDDLERGHGALRVRMTDEKAFEVGRNLAVTPGKVICKNDLMELIQYAPASERVFERPLLIVPPWINKYYVLDLNEKSSFVRWAVSQGHTVFMISWVNPDERARGKRFEDYLNEGPLCALNAIEHATGEREVNAVGYCLGGTLLACSLAYLAAKGEAPIKSATLLTTLLDFAEPGEIDVFIDEAQVAAVEALMERQGYLDGTQMAAPFAMLRANDLIWSFFINNYLMGEDPAPFDLLYWNSDSTRMPAAMHSYYLRNMYLHNRLREPNGLTLLGQKVALQEVTTPVCMVSTVDDHIAPWKSTYAGAKLFEGPVRFMLGGSGHIAGIVNPPAKKKYGHWVNDALPEKPDAWLQAATRHEGSWWPEWQRFVQGFAGAQVPARTPGAGALAALADAPGTYVRQRYS